MSYKKKFKKYMTDNFTPRDDYDIIAQRIGGLSHNHKEENKMKKKTLFSSFCIVAACAAIVVGVISFTPKKAASATAMITMDVNPSISFTIDDNQKVISVTGENSEGKMIIAGEKLIGKDLASAIEIVIETESETGYLVNGNIETNNNEITFTISLDDDNLHQKLKDNINKKVTAVCDKLNINEKINYAKAYTREQIEQLVLELDASLTSEEVKAMDYKQLISVIALYHLETSELYSQELVNLYQSAKNYEIIFAERKEVQSAIETVNNLYTTLLSGYKTLLNTLESSIDYLEQAYSEYFIDPNSDYQKAYTEVKNKKADVLAKRDYLASLDPEKDTVEIIKTKAELTIAETLLSAAEEALSIAKASAELIISAASEVIQQALDALLEIEKKLPSEITDILNNKAHEIEKNINEVKNNFFDEFENTHKDDIQKAKEEVLLWKEQLKNNIKNK